MQAGSMKTKTRGIGVLPNSFGLPSPRHDFPYYSAPHSASCLDPRADIPSEKYVGRPGRHSNRLRGLPSVGEAGYGLVEDAHHLARFGGRGAVRRHQNDYVADGAG